MEEPLCNVEFLKSNSTYLARVQSDLGGMREYRSGSLEEILEQVIIDLQEEFEEVISSYYGEEQVAALVTFKIDTKGSDQVAQKIASFDHIEDVFLVTGDTDIIAKARFPNYAALKKFIVDDVADIDGIKETKTFMVVTTFRERGKVQQEQEEPKKEE